MSVVVGDDHWRDPHRGDFGRGRQRRHDRQPGADVVGELTTSKPDASACRIDATSSVRVVVPPMLIPKRKGRGAMATTCR